MDPPSYIVVPPTPVSFLDRPRLTPLTTSTTLSSSLPELSPSAIDRDRSSSETTIVTIYSMYEEDAGSWSASEAGVAHRHRQPKDVDVAITGSSSYRDSYLQANGSALEDSAYYDTTSAKPYDNVVDLSQRSSVLSDGSVQLAYTSSDSRPSSAYARTSTVNCEVGRSVTHSLRRSLVHSPEPAPQPRPSRSRPSSSHRKSSSSQKNNSRPNGDTSRIDPSSSAKALPQPPSQSSHSPQQPSPQQVSSSQIASSSLSPHASLSSPPPQSLLTPPSSPRRPSPSSSPSSKHSVLPSEGEDPDAFHVRSTYAQLEVCGVKGDGIEEGVERTRARVGGSRASELRAFEALGDGQEKTRELTQEETELLASLDRYGFYVTPSHDRLILLPAAPLLKPLAHTAAAVTTSPPSAPLLPAQPPTPRPPKELSRMAKWGRMLEARARDEGGNVDLWGIKPAKERKLRERVFKGVPDCWRSAAWEVLMCRFARTGKPELRRLAEEYREVLDHPSTYDVQIDLDVPRTIGGHVMFRTRYGQGQRSLFHVLHCLSLRCETCGYCQGMGPIAATLLCYFDPERVYAALVRLHDSYSMHSIFSPGFPGLLEAIYVQERITEQMLPAVYAAFKKHMISTTSYATKWYITLFANSVPFQTQLRLWDAFLLEGHDLFVVVAVAIVWVYRDHITSDAASFETVLSLLSSFFVPEDENALLSWIEKVISDKKLRDSMQRWRSDWNRLVASGEHTQALL
ncbi:RabGAP/TBC [Obba rivulosa]|uniref:RabGAP/TBC n=1 Tax=Obba rivulosa TaxID=1052685 RepID=A0A8E2AYQ8_9APHY|nr:RabGAP/TBC [Obba rivulosa]